MLHVTGGVYEADAGFISVNMQAHVIENEMLEALVCYSLLRLSVTRGSSERSSSEHADGSGGTLLLTSFT